MTRKASKVVKAVRDIGQSKGVVICYNLRDVREMYKYLKGK